MLNPVDLTDIDDIVTNVNLKDGVVDYVKIFKVINGVAAPLPNQLSKHELIREIEQENSRVYTAIIRDDTMSIESRIHIVNVEGQKYVRTDGNDIVGDNLTELPPFDRWPIGGHPPTGR